MGANPISRSCNFMDKNKIGMLKANCFQCGKVITGLTNKRKYNICFGCQQKRRRDHSRNKKI